MTAFDAGALQFKLQTIGAALFRQDQADAKQAIEKTGTAAQTAKGQVDGLGTATDATGKKAKASKAPLDEQARSTKKVGEESDESAKKQKKQTAATEEQIASAKQLSAALLIAGTAVAALVGLAVAKSTEFGAAMSNVRAATMATADEQKNLADAALDAGADTAYSAREAAEAEEELAKAGQSVSQIIGGSLNGALSLAAAGQLEVARSAEIMATTLTQFRLPAEQAAHVSDVLAAGAGKAQGSVDDLALALSYVGPLAGSVGLSLDETAGTIAYFATQGIIGEKAGTSLRGVLASLQAPSAAAQKEMDKYSISMFDGSGNMLSMAGIAQQLKTRLGGLTEQERLAALGRIFGNESLNAATLLYEGGAAKVDEWTSAVNDSGFAADQAAMRQDNLAGDVEKLGGAFDTALIRTGSGANDVLRLMVQTVTQLVDAYGEAPAPIQATVVVVGAAAAAMLLFAGGAVGARAKFLELKDALDKSNVSMNRTAILGAGAGLALTGVLTVVGLLMAAQAEARQRAEAYADAIESGADRSSRAFADLADEALEANTKLFGAFDLGGDSAYEAAEKLGISLGTVRDAANGSAPALRELQELQEEIANSDTESLMEKYGFTIAEAQLAEANINTVINAVKGNNATIEESIGLAERRQQADEESVETSESAAEAYMAPPDSVEDLNNQLRDLINQINDANEVAVDAITANADYLAALDGLEDQAKKLGLSLDENSVSGSANAAAMADLSSKAREAAEAQFTQDLATMSADDAAKKWNATLEDQKQAFIDSAVAAGYNANQVKALADRIFQMPSKKNVDVLVATARAQQQIDSYISRNTGREIIIRIGTSRVAQGPGGGGGITQADGGIVNFADGGVRPPVSFYANGGRSEHHVAQIARAGEWRVWAEPETGGEAYIPLAPSKRARSELVMAETAERMGGAFIPANARAFSDGSPVAGGDAVGSLIAEVRALRGTLGRPNVSFVNPVQRDVRADAWEAAQVLQAGG